MSVNRLYINSSMRDVTSKSSVDMQINFKKPFVIKKEFNRVY